MMDLIILANTTGMDGIVESGENIVKWLQRGGIVAASISFAIAAYYLLLGGGQGRMRCVPWLIGGAVGLIVLMGAQPIAEGIDSQVQFEFIAPLQLKE